VPNTATAVAAGAKVLLATIALSNPGINETVRRTRGWINVNQTLSGTKLGALGFVVVNDLAIAAGVASMPGPFTDADDDGWFVWQAYGGSRPLTTASESHIFEFDSKAMRRVEEGFGIAVIAETAGGSVDPVLVSVAISLLTSIT